MPGGIIHKRTRRRFLLGAGAALAVPHAYAQPEKTYRLGWLTTSAASLREPQARAFEQRLRELGFVEGRNLVLDRYHADNRLERLPAVAAAIARHRYDVLFTGGGDATLAAAVQASKEAPIVVIAVDFDPVASGDVASLARPGGRVTGVSAQQAELPAKRLELLRELLPRVSRPAVLANEQTQGQLALVQGTARRMGLDIHVIDFKRPPFDFQAAFAEMARQKCDALFALGSGLFVPARNEITRRALEARLPSVFHNAQWVDAGGLMSYGFNFPSMWRRGAEMVAAILRGAKAGELPMEVPTHFELALNLKSARALGVKVPQSMLLRADRVLE